MIVRYRLDEAHVEVRVSDEGLVEPLLGLFPSALAVDEDGRRPGISVTVREAGGLLRVDGETKEFDSVPDMLAALEFAVTERLLSSDAAHTHIHAAGATVAGRALMALGPSGSGKSSIAVVWSQMGLPLLGDDVVRMDAAGTLRPFPRLLKVAPSLLTERGLTLEDTPAWELGADEAWFDPRGGGGWAAPVPAASVLAQIRYVGGGSCRVRDLDRAAGLRLLLDSVLRTGIDGKDSFDRFVEVVEKALILEIEFGIAHEAAERMAELGDLPATVSS